VRWRRHRGGGVVDILTGLVDRSLVVAEEHDSAFRYRLLDPIRQYAADKLVECGESATWRERHAAWFLDVAEGLPGTAGWAGAHEIAAFDRLSMEHDN
jgi:non-specific serine/threonine protein kinase